jgi:hypothetical protein
MTNIPKLNKSDSSIKDIIEVEKSTSNKTVKSSHLTNLLLLKSLKDMNTQRLQSTCELTQIVNSTTLIRKLLIKISLLNILLKSEIDLSLKNKLNKQNKLILTQTTPNKKDILK